MRLEDRWENDGAAVQDDVNISSPNLQSSLWERGRRRVDHNLPRTFAAFAVRIASSSTWPPPSICLSFNLSDCMIRCTASLSLAAISTASSSSRSDRRPRPNMIQLLSLFLFASSSLATVVPVDVDTKEEDAVAEEGAVEAEEGLGILGMTWKCTCGIVCAARAPGHRSSDQLSLALFSVLPPGEAHRPTHHCFEGRCNGPVLVPVRGHQGPSPARHRGGVDGRPSRRPRLGAPLQTSRRAPW